MIGCFPVFLKKVIRVVADLNTVTGSSDDLKIRFAILSDSELP